MANIFRKFKKRVGSGSHNTNNDGSNNSRKKGNNEFEYIDPVGNFSFPTSPRSLITPAYGNSAELTIFWTQPRPTRERKDNPVYVNEPVDFYEDFIPAENIHEIHGRDRRSWAASGNENTGEPTRSKSLSYIPSLTYDDQKISLPELRRQRQNDDGVGHSSGVEKLTNLFHPPDALNGHVNYGRDNNSDQEVIDERIVPLNQVDVEEEPIEVLLTRKLAEFESDRDASSLNYVPLSTFGHPARRDTALQSSFDISDEERIRDGMESMSYWASSESLDNNIENDNLSFSQVAERKLRSDRSDDDVFHLQTPQSEEPNYSNVEYEREIELVSWSSAEMLETEEKSYESDFITDNMDTCYDKETNEPIGEPNDTGRRPTWPRGTFIKSRKATSLENLPKASSSFRYKTRAGIVQHKFKTDDLFFNMEKTLNELELRLNEVLETDPADNFPMRLDDDKSDRMHNARVESVKSFLLAPPENNLRSRNRSWSLNALPTLSDNSELSPVLRIPKKPWVEEVIALNVDDTEASPTSILDNQHEKLLISSLENEQQVALNSIKFSTSVKHSKKDIVTKEDGTFSIAPISDTYHYPKHGNDFESASLSLHASSPTSKSPTIKSLPAISITSIEDTFIQTSKNEGSVSTLTPDDTHSPVISVNPVSPTILNRSQNNKDIDSCKKENNEFNYVDLVGNNSFPLSSGNFVETHSAAFSVNATSPIIENRSRSFIVPSNKSTASTVNLFAPVPYQSSARRSFRSTSHFNTFKTTEPHNFSVNSDKTKADLDVATEKVTEFSTMDSATELYYDICHTESEVWSKNLDKKLIDESLSIGDVQEISVDNSSNPCSAFDPSLTIDSNPTLHVDPGAIVDSNFIATLGKKIKNEGTPTQDFKDIVVDGASSSNSIDSTSEMSLDSKRTHEFAIQKVNLNRKSTAENIATQDASDIVNDKSAKPSYSALRVNSTWHVNSRKRIESENWNVRLSGKKKGSKGSNNNTYLPSSNSQLSSFNRPSLNTQPSLDGASSVNLPSSSNSPSLVGNELSVDDLPSYTFDLNKEQNDDEDQDTSYLNVEGPVNDRTSSGVTLFRRGSSVYHVRNKKKKSYIDELMEGSEPERVYPDRACKRTIMSLMVRCYNFGNDCEWTGELGNLQDHIEQCQLVAVECVNACGRNDIPRNQCSGCNTTYYGKTKCHFKMNHHIESDGDCPLAVVLCRYNDVGCKFKCRRLDMPLHIQETVEQHLDLAHTRIRELEVRQENICMNGKFLWKISNYDHLMKQSATKKDKEKLCSPPFYTGQYGYKLRAEAFLNGLGQGKGSHLSLYVVIMKGEYDAILPWPFKQNVDFFLMDQDDDIATRQNKVWKLSCERNSDYFKRPTKSKSLGFGCPKFVSLDTLATRNYIRDQTIFIKIVVEPTDGIIFNPTTSPH